MPEHLEPSAAAAAPTAVVTAEDESPAPAHLEPESLRLLSRSPHPYHRQQFELLEPSDRFQSVPFKPEPANHADTIRRESFPAFAREATTSSDSGTDADDEHFLKGLPAPRTKLHKGVRGRNEFLSGTSTPVLSPAILEEQGNRPALPVKKEIPPVTDVRNTIGDPKRRKEILRRTTEVVILLSLGFLVFRNPNVRPIVRRWSRELLVTILTMLGLGILYPLRLINWGYQHRSPSAIIPVSIPSSFDPAALIYPSAITLCVSLLISVDNEAVVLPNIILALSSLPAVLIPAASPDDTVNPLHWVLSCLPLFLSPTDMVQDQPLEPISLHFRDVRPETAVLLYPLHQYLCITLYSLTTTSLLPAELQLLSISLLNVLFNGRSPQVVILKSLLWVGGLEILVLCSQVIMWGISLARVPKWRFKRAADSSKNISSFFSGYMSWKRVKHDLFHAPMDSSSCSSCEALDDGDESEAAPVPAKTRSRLRTGTIDGADSSGMERSPTPAVDPNQAVRFKGADGELKSSPAMRRHTLPNIGRPRKSHKHTPSGRRKRSASSSVRAFFSLTQSEAAVRKWLYAGYVYICIVAIIFVPIPGIGVKEFVGEYALHGYEPVGWALGYLFGDLPWFRLEVVSRNLERWICLPPRFDDLADPWHMGWVQYLRQSTFGEANTRLLLSAYCLAVIGVGLIVVLQLSPLYEVDTRRKVFHFMMVAMFAPSTYIDPTFAALALSLVLAMFLLLDLLRASQLPPLSKPLASFLAPYVDGRDLRGPVVISHIFLLIGCAIPLWLSLASLPRTGAGYLAGWEIPTRDVSMIAGVICVGLGDAAASLIGRRYGHRKWVWGGGKSLEGSLAFAVAVFIGLMAAHIWLWVGGWPVTGGALDSWSITIQKAAGCATVASLTEAVLTGGNDNVIVPVVLWTCVKSLGV